MRSVRKGKPRLLPNRTMLVFVAATLAAPAAWAGSREMERAAQAACLSGDYSKGVAILAELYVDTREAIYIFNQGRCFEQSGRYEDAIIRFREFQRKNASAGRALDPEAEKHIADCQALLDKQKPVPPAAPAPAVVRESSLPSSAGSTLPTSPAPLTPAFSSDDNEVDLTQTPPPSGDRSEGSILGRWWFWTAVGAVVAGGVTAGLLLSRDGGTKPFCPECDYSAGVNLK